MIKPPPDYTVARIEDELDGIIQPGKIDVWLHKPNPAFGNQTPFSLILDGREQELWNIIFVLKTGMPGETMLFYESEAENLNQMTGRVFRANVEAGWWKDRENPLIVPTKLALIHSEVSEAIEGHRKDEMDDKLPHRTMLECELADVIIRVMDLAGFLGIDLGTVVKEKSDYNAVRADHKPENREKKGGKKY